MATPGVAATSDKGRAEQFLSRPRMAGFPLAFLVTPRRTGAVGNLLLLLY